MNKDRGESPDRAPCFEAPDFSQLYARSIELRDRTRVVYEDMKNQSRRIHEAIAESDKLLNEHGRRRLR
jgi:hypothetical protein